MIKISLEIDDQPWGSGEISEEALTSKKLLLNALIKIIPEDRPGTFVKTTINDQHSHTMRKDLFDNLMSTNSFKLTAGEGNTAICHWKNLNIAASVEDLYGHGRARLNLKRVFKNSDEFFEPKQATYTVGNYPHKMDYVTFESLRIASPSTYIKLIAPAVSGVTSSKVTVSSGWRAAV